jgi:uncharacterized protein (TIGR02145 family)
MKKRIWGIFAAGLFFPTFSIYCQNTPSPLTKVPALIPGQRISPPSKLNNRINTRKPTIPVASDRDGDGVQDSYDRCPDEKGEKRNFGCPTSNSKQVYYPAITIGNQVWMQNNLNTDRFRNGDLIPEAKSNEEWKRFGEERKPAWCYYENDAAKGVVYGKLYNFYAVTDPRGLAPQGWHVPTFDEWSALVTQSGGDQRAGLALKANNYWRVSGESTRNSGGFLAMAAGYRTYNGNFHYLGELGNFWCIRHATSTQRTVKEPCYYSLTYNSFGIMRYSVTGVLLYNGYSVRCLKDRSIQ